MTKHNFKSIFWQILVLALLISLGGCSGPPTQPSKCPTGVDVTVQVIYKRSASAKPDSDSVPRLYHRVLGGGQYLVTVMSKMDYYTWSATLTVPENAAKAAHTVHVPDFALLPGTIITASDIFVEGILVTKSQFPGGEGEFGSFRVDGCKTIYP